MNTFKEYGTLFQSKIIASLIMDRMFLLNTIDILLKDYFLSLSFKKIFLIIKLYYETYNTNITLDALAIKVKGILNNILKLTVILDMKQVISSIKSNDLQYVQDESSKFCVNQKMVQAITKSILLIQLGDYLTIRSLIEAALTVGHKADLGDNYFDNIDERYLCILHIGISTGWDCLDRVTKGGIGKKQLGIVMAPSNTGKSWILSKIAAQALRDKKNVCYITVDMTKLLVLLRLDCVIAGIPITELALRKLLIKLKLKDLRPECGKILVKLFPMYSLSTSGLKSYLKRVLVTHFRPDVVIIDYADVLKHKSSKTEATHLIIGRTYGLLKGIAGLGYLIWTASQTNKGALELQVIDLRYVADSYKKVHPGDFIISFQRTILNSNTYTGTVFVVKNRMGPAKITYPVYVNLENGLIDIYDMKSEKGKQLMLLITKKQDKGLILSESYKEMINKKENKQ